MKRREFIDQLTKAAGGVFAFSAFARNASFLAAAATTSEAVAQTIPVVAFRNRRPMLAESQSVSYTSQDGRSWVAGTKFPNSKGPKGTFLGAAYLGSTYCLSTDSNGVVTSTNLTTWVLQSAPFGGSRIIANGSLFLMCDPASNQTATSTNGSTWTTRSTPLSFTNSFVWTGTQFFACSDTQGATSPDGVAWTLRTLPAPVSNWGDVAWNGSKLCMNDSGGTAAASSDGITWTTTTFTSGKNFYQIVAFGTKFAAFSPYGSGLAISSDGVNWTYTSPSTYLTSVGGSPTNIIGLVGGQICTSPDGTTFTSKIISGSNVSCSYTANGVSFVLGSSTSTALTSTDQNTWTARTLPTVYIPSAQLAFARSPSRIVAIPYAATQSVLTSTDQGKTWAVNYTALPSATAWGTMAYGGGRFVVMTTNSTYSTAAAYSTDGLTWTAATMPSSQLWSAVAWNGTNFCAVSMSGTVAATSTNGVAWAASTLPSSSSFKLIASNKTNFVTASFSSAVAAYSATGSTWTQVTLPASDTWVSIVWNGTYYCLLGIGGTYCTSPTGAVWTLRSFPVTGSFTSLTYNGAYLIATDQDYNALGISNDGVNWTSGTYTGVPYAIGNSPVLL